MISTSRFQSCENANSEPEDFEDYGCNIGCALIAKIDWSKPILSWLILRYNGSVVKRNSAGKPVLSFKVIKEGYYFRSKNIDCCWKNSAYHDVGAFGLPSGSLLDTKGKTIAKAIRSSPADTLSTNGKVSYDLFDIIINDRVFKLKLEVEVYYGLIKGDAHLLIYDNNSPVFATSKNGYYNEIFIINNNDYIPVLFPVFFSFLFNFPWIDV
ncbi:hypothetical protein FACS1894189_6780 [Planctomycetales bacterium]|nr:hypothetical protein FACS1894189_6780 [Planctomycetales bacterium]